MRFVIQSFIAKLISQLVLFLPLQHHILKLWSFDRIKKCFHEVKSKRVGKT